MSGKKPFSALSLGPINPLRYLPNNRILSRLSRNLIIILLFVKCTGARIVHHTFANDKDQHDKILPCNIDAKQTESTMFMLRKRVNTVLA